MTKTIVFVCLFLALPIPAAIFLKVDAALVSVIGGFGFAICACIAWGIDLASRVTPTVERKK